MMGDISNFARHNAVSVVEFADYLRECLPPVQWPEAEAERDTWRQRLPYSLVVKLFYPQLDFAERWCWLTFGECFGECLQRQSEYPSCFEPLPHCHNGRWRARWLEKAGYDFGYCEWLFAEEEAFRRFAAFVPEIGFGEHYG